MKSLSRYIEVESSSYIEESVNSFFNEYDQINESVQNFFENDKSQKKKYAQQVWDILQNAYASQGGIKGSGFNSVDDMIKNIPYWKLDIVDDEVLVVSMYKFKDSEDKTNLRKCIASGTLYDESRRDDIKRRLYNFKKEEFSRSISEISGKMEDYYKRYLKDLYLKYRIPYEKAIKILPDDELIQIDEFRYKRLIGGNYHEKIMIGTANSKY